MQRLTSSSRRTQDLVQYLLISVAFCVLCVVWDHVLLPGDRGSWDARVYARAVTAWTSGGDPYQIEGVGLPFVYPPIFLIVAGALSNILPGSVAWLLYRALTLASTLAIPAVLATYYFRSRWLTPLAALILLVLEPRLMGEIVLLSGNFSSILYAAILIGGIPGIRRNRWTWFYVAVVCAALVKPPFLAFLLIPLVAGRRQFWNAVGAVWAAAMIFALQIFTMPVLYKTFQNAVVVQVVKRGDAGYGLLSLFLKVQEHVKALTPTLSMGLFGLVMLSFVAVLIRVRPRDLSPEELRDPASRTPSLWLPLLVVTVIFFNPRLQDYDAEIALVPAIYLVGECLQQLPLGRLRGAAVCGFAGVFVTLLSRQPELAVSLFLVAAIVLTLWQLAILRRVDAAVPEAQELRTV